MKTFDLSSDTGVMFHVISLWPHNYSWAKIDIFLSITNHLERLDKLEYIGHNVAEDPMEM